MIEYSPYGMATNAICRAVIHVHVLVFSVSRPDVHTYGTHTTTPARLQRRYVGLLVHEQSPFIGAISRVNRRVVYTLNVKKVLRHLAATAAIYDELETQIVYREEEELQFFIRLATEW